MSPTLRIFIFAIVILYTAGIICLIIRKKLLLKYSLLWLTAGLLMLILAIFPQILDFFTDIVGITLPINMLFLFSILGLIVLCIALTVILSKQTERVRELSQKYALLEKRVRELEGKGKDD